MRLVTSTHILVLGIALTAAGCGVGRAPQQTASMQAFPGLTMTRGELRTRVEGVQGRLTTAIMSAAQQIIETEPDRNIRFNAFLWRSNAVAGIQATAFQPDPLAALGDMMAYAYQMEEFLDTGAGQDLFGASHPVAVEASREMVARVDSFAISVVGDSMFTARQPRIEEWASENRFDDLALARASAMVEGAAVSGAASVGGLAAVGAIEETLAGIADRMTIYLEYAPKQARWEAQMAMLGLYDELGDTLLTDLESITQSIDYLTDLIDQIVDTVLIGGGDLVEQVVERERILVFEEVDRQRIATLMDIRADLEAVLTDVNRQRMETITLVDSLVRVAQIFVADEATNVIDHVFLRIVQLLAVAVVGVVLIVLTYGVMRRKT